MSRGRIRLIGFVIVCVAGLAIFYLWRDLNLPQKVVFEKLPDVVVENLNFRRDIDGRDWHIIADTAEHEDGKVRASSIDMTIREGDDDRLTEIKAVSGDFVQDTSNAVLNLIVGRMQVTGRSIDMKAPVAKYEASGDLWVFPQGLEVWDNKTYLKGDVASITSEGIFNIEEGAEMFWEIK